MTVRLIYTPAIGEPIPEGVSAPAKFYELEGIGAVVDVLVPDDFTTDGIVRHDSAIGLVLSVPYIHHFAGWDF